MPYDIQFTEEQGYLRVEVRGQRDPSKEVEDAINVWAKTAALCHEKGIDRILGIVDLPGKPQTMASFDLANNPESFNWSRHFKLAVVDVNEESRKANRFTETVAVNRGFRVKIFDNEGDAKTWLFEA